MNTGKERRKFIGQALTNTWSPWIQQTQRELVRRIVVGYQPKKEQFPSMIKIQFYQWWRPLNSPANNNEFPMLELSGAWEPPDRASAW